MLLKAGRVREGLALLDEAMVAVTSSDLSPFVPGIVYCSVILSCQTVFEAGRAREWTLALDRWARGQPQMVAFTGRCLVHRAEVFQLHGSWPDALEEATRAGERFEQTRNPAAGLAHYRRAELLRLRGEFVAAEGAYHDANRFGWEPQPGLAQLRLAQGNVKAAVAAIRRASAEMSEPLKRAALMPASVEIMLAAGLVEESRGACRELECSRSATRARCWGRWSGTRRERFRLPKAIRAAALVFLRDARDLEGPRRAVRGRADARADRRGLPRARRRGLSHARARGARKLSSERSGPRPTAPVSKRS